MADDGGGSSNLMVIFGITGDLARKMTFRALYRLEARKLLERNERDKAALYLQRAEADAQLALALAREAPARAEAQRAHEQLQQLQPNPVQQ